MSIENVTYAFQNAACQKALEAIQAAGEKDGRAHAEWLKMCHPEYRQAGTKIDISATATGQQANIVCTHEQREALIAQRERLLAGSKTFPVADLTRSFPGARRGKEHGEDASEEDD